MTVFEGEAHPYKENLLKIDGKTRMADVPEMRKQTLKSKSL